MLQPASTCHHAWFSFLVCGNISRHCSSSLRTVFQLLFIIRRLQPEIAPQYLTCTALHAVSSTCSESLHAASARLCNLAGVGALLEKQLVMFCPNIGLLSTCVLSLIPLLRPFSWHSFLMPVLPDKLLGFLEAPVPFIIGVQVCYSPRHFRWCVHCAAWHWEMCQSCWVVLSQLSGSLPPFVYHCSLYSFQKSKDSCCQ